METVTWFTLLPFIAALQWVAGGVAEDLASATQSHPFQASCKVTWVFSQSCASVQDVLIQRMKDMQRCTADAGAACSFSSIRVVKTKKTGTVITAQFDSALTKHVEEVTVMLYSPFQTPSIRCTGTGYSATKRFYTHLDHGGNYCTLYYLVKQDFAKQYGFEMYTDPTTCTGYTDGQNTTNPEVYCPGNQS